MKNFLLVFTIAGAACRGVQEPQSSADADLAKWERQATNVTIIRDQWGIPHIYGQTDANTVFGLMYA